MFTDNNWIGFLMVVVPVVIIWILQGQKEQGKAWAKKLWIWSWVLLAVSIAAMYYIYFSSFK